jgi:hypothetical protein
MANSYTISIVVQGKDDASNVLSNVERGLQKVTDTAQKSSGGVGGFFKNAFAFATGGIIGKAIDGITGSFGALKDGMIGGNAAFEDYNARFTTLLGSADSAKQRMADLAEFGAKTPFDLPGVVDADIVLQGFGLHSAEAAKKFGFSGEQIRTIAGDVASGTGTDFKEMSLLIGKFSAGATGEAISRMMELGITNKEELTKMGLEFDKSGSLLSPLPESMNTVLTLMKEKYGGLMDVQSGTFNGMMSNLQDWVGGTLRTIGQPIFETLKDKLGVLIEFLNKPETQAGLQSFANTLANGVAVAMDFIGNVAIPALQQGWEDLQPTIQAVTGVAIVLANTWTTYLQPALMAVWNFIQANLQPIMYGLVTVLLTIVIPAFVAWAAGAVAAATATIVALAPVILPIAAIGAAVALLKMGWDNDWGGIRTTLSDFWTTTGQPIFDQLVAWMQVNIPIAIQTLTDFWNNILLPALTAVWSFVSTYLIPIIVEIVQIHFQVLMATIQSVANYWNTVLLPAITAVWSFLKTYIIPIIVALIDIHFALFEVAMKRVTETWELMKGAFMATWGFIQGYLMPALKLLTNAALGPLSDMAKTAGNAFNTVLKPAISTISSFVSTTAAPAMDSLSSAIGSVSGAINGIGGAVSGAISWLGKLADKIRSMPSLPSFGGGGGDTPGFATGTTFAPGGMSWVGERGPELVNLPRGSQVFTNAQSQRMTGGATYNITYYGTGNQDERSVRDDIRYLQMLQG